MRITFIIGILVYITTHVFAFSIEFSTDLYYSKQIMQGEHDSIARYQDFIYIGGFGGVGIYRLQNDSISLVHTISNEIPSASTVFIENGKLFISLVPLIQSDTRLSRYDLTNPGYPVLEDSISWWRCDICFFDNGFLFSHEVLMHESHLRCHVVNPLDFSDEIACYTIPYQFSSLVYAEDGKCVIQTIDGAECTTHVFDISDPTNIHESFALPIGSYYAGCEYNFLSDNRSEYLLFSAYQEFISLYNITDHDAPVEIWRYDGDLLSFVIDNGNVAHILCELEMLGLDVSAPAQPQLRYQTDLDRVWDIECSEGNIITAGRFLTVHEWNGENLLDIAQAPLDGYLDYNSCNSDFLYLGTYYQSLVQVDIRNPAPPVPFRRLMPEPDGYSGAWSSCTENTLAYQYYVHEGNSGHLATKLYREAADGELSEIAYFDVQQNSLPHLRSDDELILGELGRLYRYTISDDGVELRDEIPLPESFIYSVDNYGDYLYISNDDQIFVVYAPQEGTMELVNTFDIAHVELPRFEFIDRFMIVGGIFRGEQTSIYDISDPVNPSCLYGLDPVGPMGVDEENQLLFVGYDECNVYNLAPLIESGNEPEFVTSFYCSDSITGLFPLGDSRMVCVNRVGAEYIEYSHVDNDDADIAPVCSCSLSVYPNPFNPETTFAFALEKPSRVSLDIYNIRGQRVRTLTDERMESGIHRVTWHGRDDNNRPVGSGVYFARIVTEAGTVVKKVVLIK